MARSDWPVGGTLAQWEGQGGGSPESLTVVLQDTITFGFWAPICLWNTSHAAYPTPFVQRCHETA